MSKRKNGNDVLMSPQKDKKPKNNKRPASDSSDSDPEDEEQVEVEETKIEDGQVNYEPDEFRLLLQSFNEFVRFRQSTNVTVHNMEKIVSEWANEKDEGIDAGLFLADFRRHMKTGTRVKNFQINDAIITVNTYVGSEKALSEFKSLPEKPQSKIQLYIKKNNIELKGVKGAFIGDKMKETFNVMHNDAEGSREVDEMLKEITLQYIPQLQEFVDSRPNLTDEQKRSVLNKIKTLNKKFNEPAKTPKKKTPKKEPETAYSLFCKSNGDKYRDLSEDGREKKLRKKFNKLPKDQIELLESLAINM